ncbi:hypothetical protein BP5796_05473 [Coleophoma crateriformis]|uniref:Uncharacterized protein n=1 Tax=Coleophoma crateriformis TaxID=565419 RepID=A0A3D8S3C4_9HELO|nr:hypothetical protein BP5796_05473 [Coleophoma crateriformis]
MSTTTNITGVYLGHWVNWSFGTVRGSTVTLTQGHGTLLNNFIAIFITYVGTRTWSIICLVTHQALSKKSPQDAIYHQQQVLLRNSSGGQTTAWRLSMLAWALRRDSVSTFLRILSFALFSLATPIAFMTAGITSAQVSSAMGNEVLLSGQHCGRVQLNLNASQFDINNFLNPYYKRLMKGCSTRAQQCYAMPATPEQCPTFIKTNLSIHVSPNASCPFRDWTCQKNSGNLILETGHLNIHTDFGVNTRPEDRITVYQRFHCAPLNLRGYSNVSNSYLDSNGQATLAYDAREVVHLYFGKRWPGQPNNLTYEYPLNRNATIAEYGWGITQSPYFAYRLNAERSFGSEYDPNIILSDFQAIDDLQHDTADTQLFFLSANGVSFGEQVDDPWYSAHKIFYDLPNTQGNLTGNTVYQADNAVNVIGCAMQFQYCNPNMPLATGCGPLTTGPLTSTTSATKYNLSIFKTEAQKQNFLIMDAIFRSTPAIIPTYLVQALGTSLLASDNYFSAGSQAPLPDNQWQLDMKNIFGVGLAAQQQAFFDFANGPSSSLPQIFFVKPNDDYEQAFCKSQKILRTDYTSFSTLGLALTFVLGGFLISTSYALEPLLHSIQRKRKSDSYASIEWYMNDILQLQKCIYEKLGLGPWTCKADGTPTTACKELAVLDLSDPKNPCWRAQDTTPKTESLPVPKVDITIAKTDSLPAPKVDISSINMKN